MDNFKLLFCTDLHLNFVSENTIKAFCEKIIEHNPTAIVITGDIAEAPTITNYLGLLDFYLKNHCPIFFVLGNHDYYHGSIAAVRQSIKQICTYNNDDKKHLKAKLGWLTSSGVIPLTKTTALIGHDGWYDGQYANWFQSRVFMNDYIVINELSNKACPTRELRFNKINELAREAATYVEIQLREAFKTFEHVYIATHVPPFMENATYQGKISDDNWMPHFSSKHMGDKILEMAQEFPNKQFTVLCGHSHGAADNNITSNVRCITGEASYRHPKINHIFEIE